jgi:transposase-like protein
VNIKSQIDIVSPEFKANPFPFFAALRTSQPVYLRINGQQHLARSDQNGDVLDIMVQSGRDKKSSKKFFRKLLKGLRYIRRVIVTDKLRSYNAARTEVMSSVEHVQQKYQNRAVMKLRFAVWEEAICSS